MPNILIVWIGINLLVLYCMAICESAVVDMSGSVVLSSTEDPLESARKHFIEREKRFLKKQPLSNHLISFIERAKRSKKRKKKKRENLRSKRSNKNINLYVYRNGRLIPFKNFPKRQVDANSLLEGYTVVPLVIPVSYAVPKDFDDSSLEVDQILATPAPIARLNVTISKDLFTIRRDNPNLIDMASDMATLYPLFDYTTENNELFTLDPQLFMTLPPEITEVSTMKSTGSSIESSSRSGATTGTTSHTHSKNSRSSTSKSAGKSLANLKISLDIDGEDTKKSAIKQRSEFIKEREQKQVLGRILTDVEALLDEENCPGSKEGIVCDVVGSWLSEAAGMKIEVNRAGQSSLKIALSDQTPPKTRGFMCNLNWTFTAEDPVEHSGLIHMHGANVKDKEIASFLGECRNCEGLETITGNWIIRRHSRDCRDRNAAEKTVSDVWRRDNLQALQQQHLAAINSSHARD